MALLGSSSLPQPRRTVSAQNLARSNFHSRLEGLIQCLTIATVALNLSESRRRSLYLSLASLLPATLAAGVTDRQFGAT